MSEITSEQMLSAVNNAIFTILNGGAVQSYKIGDMELQKMPLDKLTSLRDKLIAETNSTKNACTYVEFTEPI